METKQITVYSVVAERLKLRCINTNNGNIVATITLPGEIVSGPIVTGDRCVVVIKTTLGNKGKIFKLPNFSIITSFNT
jgi:hypothetical protein